MDRPFKKGFTLIELLVVIGLISVLLALIVPALGRSKEQSRMVICQSNQKNIVLGCLAYASENNSSLPVDQWLHNSHEGLITLLSDNGIIDESRIYYCPSERRVEFRYSEENFTEGNITYFYYSYSQRATLGCLSKFFLKTYTEPRALKDTMNGNKWVCSDTWLAGAEGLDTAHRWYGKGINYVTIDGSIHMVKDSPKDSFR